VLAAVRQNGWALRFASAELTKDREVVLAAVTRYAGALEFAPTFQGDPEIVMEAVVQNGRALMFASEALRVDRKVVLAAVSENYRVLSQLPYDLRVDREFYNHAFFGKGNIMKLYRSKNPENIKQIEDRRKGVIDIVQKAIAMYRFQSEGNKSKELKDELLKELNIPGHLACVSRYGGWNTIFGLTEYTHRTMLDRLVDIRPITEKKLCFGQMLDNGNNGFNTDVVNIIASFVGFRATKASSVKIFRDNFLNEIAGVLGFKLSPPVLPLPAAPGLAKEMPEESVGSGGTKRAVDDANNQNAPKKSRSKSADLSGGEEKYGSPASSTVGRKRERDQGQGDLPVSPSL
jgi:hypothetical protein